LIILDNNVLSAYTRLNQLDLITKLFKETVIPLGVYEEYIKGNNTEPLPDWIIIKNMDENELNEAKSVNLGTGEAQSIVLAAHRNCILGLDDEKARETARNRNITIIGSIGILRLAYESGYIETFGLYKDLLRRLSEDLYLEDWLIAWALEADNLRRGTAQ
jgi:hypothetical protein